MNDKKKSLEEVQEELYELAKKEVGTEFKKSKCVEYFGDGYKAGFRDGYLAAIEEIRNMPPEVKKQIEEGAQPIGWPWGW